MHTGHDKNPLAVKKTKTASRIKSCFIFFFLQEQTANKLTAAEKTVKLTKEVSSDQDNKKFVDTVVSEQIL